MAKELIYKDFDMLAVGVKDFGIEVYKEKDYYLVCEWSIYHSGAEMVRLKDPVDWSNDSALGEAWDGVRCGRIEGQIYYKNRWYSTSTIRQIMKDRQDYDWQRYVSVSPNKYDKISSGNTKSIPVEKREKKKRKNR